MILSANCIKYGDDINTDLIIAGKYTKTLNVQDLVDHVMEDLDPCFREKAGDKAFIVAGKNFGCGSSREQAPVALKLAGTICVIAKSFARIFFRNAVNIGLPIIECDTAQISDGDLMEYDTEKNRLVNKTGGNEIKIKPLPPIMESILREGGVVNYIRKHGNL